MDAVKTNYLSDTMVLPPFEVQVRRLKNEVEERNGDDLDSSVNCLFCSLDYDLTSLFSIWHHHAAWKLWCIFFFQFLQPMSLRCVKIKTVLSLFVGTVDLGKSINRPISLHKGCFFQLSAELSDLADLRKLPNCVGYQKMTLVSQ